ncbi:UDP-glycosyltransferase 74F2 [Forsythia ovata]|uniref:UDP-glycosyltransferase 74F2 n=1 Tax=Forsythia ovata TaxID=205694 RepID=A0ABD1W4V2_9LAMI
MEKGKENHKGHCLILSYPIQGHINPMLQFAKRLRHKGVKITSVVIKFFRKTMQEFSGSSNISLEAISDGFDGGRAEAESSEAYLAQFRLVGIETLSELVEKHKTYSAVKCIIYDPFLSWGLDVAKKFGLVSAAFFTQSCAVDNIYYHVYKKELKLPLSDTEKFVNIPGLPVLESSYLPSFVYFHGSYPVAFEMILNQFQNLEKADWILINTFHKLEEEVIDCMAKFLPVKAISPTIPSMYLDKRLQDDKDYSLSVFKPITDVCMKWLNE